MTSLTPHVDAARAAIAEANRRLAERPPATPEGRAAMRVTKEAMDSLVIGISRELDAGADRRAVLAAVVDGMKNMGPTIVGNLIDHRAPYSLLANAAFFSLLSRSALGMCASGEKQFSTSPIEQTETGRA